MFKILKFIRLHQAWLVGLGVWFSLWVREVPGSNPGQARIFFSISLCLDNFFFYYKYAISSLKSVIFSPQPYLVKAWRRLFYSDASCSIFQVSSDTACSWYFCWLLCVLSPQNSFWWIWMDYFKVSSSTVIVTHWTLCLTVLNPTPQASVCMHLHCISYLLSFLCSWTKMCRQF